MPKNTELQILIDTANTLLMPAQEDAAAAPAAAAPAAAAQAAAAAPSLLTQKKDTISDLQRNIQALQQQKQDKEALLKQKEAEKAQGSVVDERQKQAEKTLQEEVAAIIKQIEERNKLLEYFDELKASNTNEVEIPYAPDNPVKSIKYFIPGHKDQAKEQDVPDPRQGDYSFVRPKVCACEVEFKNNVKLTMYPDKMTEVDYDDTHPNASVEAIVEDTVTRIKEHYESTGEIPHIQYEFPGFPADSTTKAILEQHVFALTMQKMLVTPLRHFNKETNQTEDSLKSYAFKQDLVVEGFRLGGWTSDKISKTGVSLGSLFVGPDSKTSEEQYLSKVYGKENRDILDNFKPGSIDPYFANSSMLANLANEEKPAFAGLKQHFAGIRDQLGTPNRQRFIHHYLREYISTLGPENENEVSTDIKNLLHSGLSETISLPSSADNGSKRENALNKLGEQGVTKTQVSELVQTVGIKLSEVLHSALQKDDALACNYLDLEAVGKLIEEDDLEKLQEYGLTAEQVKSALANQIYNANEAIRSHLSTKDQALITVQDFNDHNSPLKILNDAGVKKEELDKRIPEIIWQNALINWYATQGLSRTSTARQSLYDAALLTRINPQQNVGDQPPQGQHAQNLLLAQLVFQKNAVGDVNLPKGQRSQDLYLLESRWERARKLVNKLVEQPAPALQQDASASSSAVSVGNPQSLAASHQDQGEGPAQAAAAENPRQNFISENQDKEEYKELKALGFDDDSIFKNAVYQQMMKDYIEKTSKSLAPVDHKELKGYGNLNPALDEIINTEISSRTRQIYDCFLALTPDLVLHEDFLEQLKTKEQEDRTKETRTKETLAKNAVNLNKLKVDFGLTDEEIRKLNNTKNCAFNQLVKQLHADRSPLNRAEWFKKDEKFVQELMNLGGDTKKAVEKLKYMGYTDQNIRDGVKERLSKFEAVLPALQNQQPKASAQPQQQQQAQAQALAAQPSAQAHASNANPLEKAPSEAEKKEQELRKTIAAYGFADDMLNPAQSQQSASSNALPLSLSPSSE